MTSWLIEVNGSKSAVDSWHNSCRVWKRQVAYPCTLTEMTKAWWSWRSFVQIIQEWMCLPRTVIDLKHTQTCNFDSNMMVIGWIWGAPIFFLTKGMICGCGVGWLNMLNVNFLTWSNMLVPSLLVAITDSQAHLRSFSSESREIGHILQRKINHGSIEDHRSRLSKPGTPKSITSCESCPLKMDHPRGNL